MQDSAAKFTHIFVLLGGDAEVTETHEEFQPSESMPIPHPNSSPNCWPITEAYMVISHKGPTNKEGKGIMFLERVPRGLFPTCHSMNQHWSKAFFLQSVKLIVKFLICKCPASQVPLSRNGALSPAERHVEVGAVEVAYYRQKLCASLHAHVKRPGTRSKK